MRIALLVVLLGCSGEASHAAPEPAPARAVPPPIADGFYPATFSDDAVPGSRPVTLGPRQGSYVRLGTMARDLVRARVVSQNNENSEYYFAAYFGRDECVVEVVVLGGDVVSSTGGGSDDSGRCLVDFSVDARHATLAAGLAHVARGDRVEIGRELEIEVALPRTTYLAGENIAAELRLANPDGAPPIQHEVVEDPRLRQIEVVATCNGRPATRPGDAMIALSILGGTHWDMLAPSQHAAPETIDLSPLVDFSQPGPCRIGLTTRVELAPADADTSALEQQHRRWTRTVHSTLALEIR